MVIHMTDEDFGTFWSIFLVVFFVVSALVALIPASIAERRGQSFGGFWLFGLFFLPFALTTALLLPPTTSTAVTSKSAAAQKKRDGVLLAAVGAFLVLGLLVIVGILFVG